MGIKDLIPWSNGGREVGIHRGTDVNPFFTLHVHQFTITLSRSAASDGCSTPLFWAGGLKRGGVLPFVALCNCASEFPRKRTPP